MAVGSPAAHANVAQIPRAANGSRTRQNRWRGRGRCGRHRHLRVGSRAVRLHPAVGAWAITVSLIVVQVQVARLGAVTGKRSGGAYPRAVRGPLDGRGYVRAADRQRSRHHGGVRRGRRGARPVRYSTNRVRRHSAFVVWLIVVRGSCSAAEKVLLVLAAALLTYVAAAVLARPNWSTMAVALVSPSFSLDAGYLTTFTTLVGTTIAPYMLFYLQSSISDKGLGLAEYPSLRTDVVIGSVLSDVVAAFSSICTAATLFAVGVQVGTADDAARALTRLAGSYATVQFALGLSGTSMLAASVLPLSTAYAICGAFGWGARCLIPLARSPGR